MQCNTEDPFSNLVIADSSFLESCSSRTKCIKCNKSRKYYCYSCCIALPHIQDKLPKVKLPLKVDIIKHPRELDGKSTAPHASILAPDDVTIHTFPCIPDYDPKKVIILFPGEDALDLEELKLDEAESDSLQMTIEHKSVLESKNKNNSANPLSDTSDKASSKTVNINTDVTSESRNSDVSLKDPPTFLGCDVTQNTKQLSNTGDSAIQTSKSDSHIDLKRKRTLSDEDNTKKGSVDHDNECEDTETVIVKHQKTHLRQCPFEKVVFVDCTWNQTKQIVNDERLKGLKRVELKSQFTHFWRSQDGMPKTYLSTIEAIYYFFKNFHSIFVDPVYKHEYDNLLIFFCFMYHKIKQSETVESA